MNFKATLTLLLLLAIATPQQSHAQIWKRLFGKEEKRKPRLRPVQKPKEKQTTQAESKKRKRKTIEYPASKIKSRYRIDVLAPLYLDELVKNNKATFKEKLPEKAMPGMSFYEGVKLAADTLTALGYNIDVFIHDITQQGLSAEELVKGDVLAETDLIIGAVQSPQIPVLAGFAQRNSINFVSAISPSDGDVKENLFFTLLQPTLETHCERIREAVLKKHGKKNLLLFHRTNNSTDSAAASYVLADDDEFFKKVSVNKPIQKSQVEQLLDSTGTNVVVMPVVDNNLAESTLQQLYALFPRYQFEVYGMPSWKFIGSLKKADAFPNVGVSFTSPFFYDFTTANATTLAGNHRKQFGGRMGEMVFRGYETLYWYAYLLQHYGTVYNARQSDNKAAPFTKFEVKVQWDGQQNLLYNENEHLYLYRYQSGSFLINSLD